MAFPRRLLDDDERVVLEVHSHWIFLAGPSLALAAAIAVAIVASNWTNRGIVLIPLLVLVLGALGWFLVRVASWSATALVVTDRRLVMRSGVLRRGQGLALDQVADITITRTMPARLLGAGDLVVASMGERGRATFVGCSHPRRVRDTIQRLADVAATSPAARPQPSRGDVTPFEQLDRLDDLRRRGVISQAEFDAKKTQLLDRL
ncbi:MAG TPA: PH domain-containing protein [Acidimicrobiales bacterium]|nr:PH domain-containing protein [Acidimicrobiales bacterium]